MRSCAGAGEDRILDLSARSRGRPIPRAIPRQRRASALPARGPARKRWRGRRGFRRGACHSRLDDPREGIGGLDRHEIEDLERGVPEVAVHLDRDIGVVGIAEQVPDRFAVGVGQHARGLQLPAAPGATFPARSGSRHPSCAHRRRPSAAAAAAASLPRVSRGTCPRKSCQPARSSAGPCLSHLHAPLLTGGPHTRQGSLGLWTWWAGL